MNAMYAFYTILGIIGWFMLAEGNMARHMNTGTKSFQARHMYDYVQLRLGPNII